MKLYLVAWSPYPGEFYAPAEAENFGNTRGRSEQGEEYVRWKLAFFTHREAQEQANRLNRAITPLTHGGVRWPETVET